MIYVKLKSLIPSENDTGPANPDFQNGLDHHKTVIALVDAWISQLLTFNSSFDAALHFYLVQFDALCQLSPSSIPSHIDCDLL